MKNNHNISFAIVGLSHLGIVALLGLASLKNSVLGIDSDQKIISSLQKGIPAVYEPGFEDLLIKLKTKLEFSIDFSKISSMDCIFFAQDTETNGSGSVEKLDFLLNNSIPYLKQDVTIICMSQVPIGYYRNLERQIKKSRPDLKFYLYHMVDTIIMTSAMDRFLNPERIIIGSTDTKERFSYTLKEFLNLFSCPIFHMSFESAELTKAAINLYLANSVVFANTLADYCEQVGANIKEIIPALQTDKRIGPFSYIWPSLRIAGGHLERDLLMLKRLAKKTHISSGIVGSIIKSNSSRYLWCEKQLDKHLHVKNRKPVVAIWGLSYKKNTDSTTNAASVLIIKNLLGKASINVYDPMAILPKTLSGYFRFDDKYQAIMGADCLLILTPWEEFKSINLQQLKNSMRNNLIIDSTGIMGTKSFLKNFKIVSIGVG